MFLAAIVAYTAVVGSALELGENSRFKFMVEPALIVLVVVATHRLVAGWLSSRDEGAGGDPGAAGL
jgi:hypothetical protein